MSAFEDGLWARLVDEHNADRVALNATSRRIRSRPLIFTAGTSAVAAATLAVVLGLSASTNTPAAYALTRNANGSVTVTIKDLETAIPALNARFKRMGIDETVIPVRAGCPTPGVVSYPGVKTTYSLTFYPDHAYLAPGYDGVLAAEQLRDGKVALLIGAMRPPLPTCFSKLPLTATVSSS